MFGASGSGLKGLGFMVQGLGLRAPGRVWVLGSVFRVEG